MVMPDTAKNALRGVGSEHAEEKEPSKYSGDPKFHESWP
jgi:hypothetical protein